jgi:hypothetical protein
MKINIKIQILAGLVAATGLVATASAATITVEDLTTLPSSQVLDNQGIVSAIDPQSTGTGVFDPFLREQGNASKSPLEAGINTSANNPPYDTKADPHTHDLLLSSLTTVKVGGTDYYKFILDANQLQNGPISLIQFKVYVTAGAPFTSASDLVNLVDNVTPNYNMNGGATQYRVDISSQNGSGSGDMSFLVPKSDIGTGDNLYLYAQFGTDANGGGFGINDGFEEWSALTGTSSVPDGGTTVLLLGAALSGLGLIRRKLS